MSPEDQAAVGVWGGGALRPWGLLTTPRLRSTCESPAGASISLLPHFPSSPTPGGPSLPASCPPLSLMPQGGGLGGRPRLGRLKGALELQEGRGGRGLKDEGGTDTGGREGVPRAWGGQDQQDNWARAWGGAPASEGRGRDPRASGCQPHKPAPAAYQHVVPQHTPSKHTPSPTVSPIVSTRSVPCTVPRTHTAPNTILQHCPLTHTLSPHTVPPQCPPTQTHCSHTTPTHYPHALSPHTVPTPHPHTPSPHTLPPPQTHCPLKPSPHTILTH